MEGKLTPEQYRILREKETEPAFTGKLLHNKETGMYRCADCGAELFSSDAKYDSGSGWPSFVAPTSDAHVRTEKDTSHGIERIEVMCANCGGHLGHVFPDGPTKMPDGSKGTGKRFCINSGALKFEKKEE